MGFEKEPRTVLTISFLLNLKLGPPSLSMGSLLTCNLSPGGIAVPPGNARSLAASPLSLPEAAVLTHLLALQLHVQLLKLGSGLGWRGQQSFAQAFCLLGALW